MGKINIRLQKESLSEMEHTKPFSRVLAGIQYTVLPKVYKASADTELLCRSLGMKRGERVWDIGTGTGFVALWAKKMGAKYVLATDIHDAAIKNAQTNSRLLRIKIDVRKANVFGRIKKKFDLITWNPPFTDHRVTKSHQMNFWDPGHKALKKFMRELRSHLTPRGRALIAWSSFAGTGVLKDIAKQNHLEISCVARKKYKYNITYYIFSLD